MDQNELLRLVEELRADNKKKDMEAEELRNQADEAVKIAEESKKIAEESKKRSLEYQKEALNEKRLRSEAESMLSLKNLSDFKTRTFSQIYVSFINSSEKISQSNFILPQINSSKLKTAWNNILSKINTYEEGKDEKKNVHPLVKEAINAILEEFCLANIKFHYESKLHNPSFVPDFTFTSSTIAEPSWQDCLSFIECKSVSVSFKEGGGQAISYLFNMLIPNAVVPSEIPEFAFSVATTGRKIQIFATKKHDNIIKKFHTPIFDLFDANCSFGNPSDGFLHLCQFVSYLSNSPMPDCRVFINGSEYDIIKTFQKSESMVVGLVDFGTNNGGKCVVKCALKNSKLAKAAIWKEALMYKILKNSPIKTLTQSQKSNFNHLVFEDVGSDDLRAWCYQLLYDDQVIISDDEKFRSFVQCFIKIFDEIRVLHNFGYTHADIRPENIVILDAEETPCLIDFVTVTKHGEMINEFQGTALYMAEELLCLEKPCRFKRKYDLEALCYTLLVCADKHYTKSFLKPDISVDIKQFDPENELRSFAHIRKSRLEILRRTNNFDHFYDIRFVELFFSLLDNLDQITDDLTDQNYNDLRQILTSFFVSN